MIIVHILTRLLRAGSEENTLATCKGQIAEGHDVYLFHGREYDQRYYSDPIAGLSLVCIESLVHPLSLSADFNAVREIARKLKDVKADVVHTHQSKAGIVGRIAAYLAKAPLIIHGVHIVPFANVGGIQKLIYLAAEKAAALITDVFVDVSKGTRDVYLQAGIGRSDNHYIVHSGFDLSRFRGAVEPEDWRDILDISDNSPRPPIIVMLAALEPRKRHVEFLNVLHKIVDRYPEVRLVMPGEGPHESVVKNRIHELGLEKNAKLIGYRTDPERIIAMADICLLVSTREGLPRVIMQYLAGGKACVVCDLPGIDEVVQDDVNGIVVGADAIDEAASTIIGLLDDSKTLERLTVGAQETDLKSWQVENMCLKMSEIYNKYKKRTGVVS